MATNLTNETIADTFSQLLHVDGGPAGSEKVVYSGTGVATALKIGTGSASVDNLKLNGNTISSTDTDGDINLTPNGAGQVVIDDVSFVDAAGARTSLGLGSIATQDSDNVTITGGAISNVTFSGSFSGMTLVQATTMAALAADHIEMTATTLQTHGDSTDIDLNIEPKGDGDINLSTSASGVVVVSTALTGGSITGTDVLATSSLGYTSTAGGTVTQSTNKSTGVTLNKVCGQIITSNASLANDSRVSFTLTNSMIAATDVVNVCIGAGATANVYDVTVTAVGNGSCRIQIHNLTNTAYGEALTINFAVLKSVTS